jgi:hypothetical protein
MYIYSLKTGINGEFLTPFEVRHIQIISYSYIFILLMILLKEKLKNHEHLRKGFNQDIEIEERGKSMLKFYE